MGEDAARVGVTCSTAARSTRRISATSRSRDAARGALRRRAARRPRERAPAHGRRGVRRRSGSRSRARRSRDDDVRLDPYPRTIELLRAERFDDPVFVVGADQFSELPRLERSRTRCSSGRTLAVATRPGFPRERARRGARAARAARARPLLRHRAESRPRRPTSARMAGRRAARRTGPAGRRAADRGARALPSVNSGLHCD